MPARDGAKRALVIDLSPHLAKTTSVPRARCLITGDGVAVAAGQRKDEHAAGDGRDAAEPLQQARRPRCAADPVGVPAGHRTMSRVWPKDLGRRRRTQEAVGDERQPVGPSSASVGRSDRGIDADVRASASARCHGISVAVGKPASIIVDEPFAAASRRIRPVHAPDPPPVRVDDPVGHLDRQQDRHLGDGAGAGKRSTRQPADVSTSSTPSARRSTRRPVSRCRSSASAWPRRWLPTGSSTSRK